MSKPPSAESNEPKPGRTLIDLARHYVMDGDYLRCRACNRPQQVMYCHSAFPDRVGCANEEGAPGHPWLISGNAVTSNATPDRRPGMIMLREAVFWFLFLLSGMLVLVLMFRRPRTQEDNWQEFLRLLRSVDRRVEHIAGKRQ
jgi:hypothetical protein